jgi:hypothetical protein
MNDRQKDKLFPLPGNMPGSQVPILGQPEPPVIMTINIVLTQKFRDRLIKWQEKVGLHINEMGAIIARIGLMEVSRRIDDPSDKINNPETYIKFREENQ